MAEEKITTIRIYAGKSYLQLAYEDIKSIEVKNTWPFGLGPTFVILTPFGEVQLTGKRAEDALKEVMGERQNEKQSAET